MYYVYEQGNMKKEWCETSKEESYSYFYPSMYTNILAAIVDINSSTKDCNFYNMLHVILPCFNQLNGSNHT